MTSPTQEGITTLVSPLAMMLARAHSPADAERMIEQLRSGFNGTMPRQWTSFDAVEVTPAIGYVALCRRVEYKAAIARLRTDLPLSSGIPHAQFFLTLDDAIAAVLGDLELHPSIADQVRQELRLQIYAELICHTDQTRMVELSDNSTRDGAQSCLGAALPIDEQCEILRRLISSRAPISRIETGGGAIPQLGLKPGAVGRKPISPFERARRVMFVLRDLIRQRIAEVEVDPDDEKLRRLFARFTVPAGDTIRREILSPSELREVLEQPGLEVIGPNTHTGREIQRIYNILATNLFRGKFGVALKEQPVAMLDFLTRRFYECGYDVIRVFDGFNFFPNLKVGINAALRAGARIQPCIQADPRFALGIPGFLQLITQEVALCGEQLEAVVVKDAAGIVTPEFAFNLGKAIADLLAQLGVTTTVVFHTHENGGSALLSAFEFVRGAGPAQRVRLEGCLGRGGFAAPNGNLDLGDLLRVLCGTQWLNGTKPWGKNGFEEEIVSLEHLAVERVSEARSNGSITLTTGDRKRMVAAGLPGGMTGTFLPQLLPALGLVAKHVRVQAFDNGERLTEPGQKLYRAFFHLVLRTMTEINARFGYLSRVTPVSQWIGVQATTTATARIEKGFFLYQHEAFAGTHQPFPETLLPIPQILPPWMNFLLQVAQDEEFARLYPECERALIWRALEDTFRWTYEDLCTLVPSSAPIRHDEVREKLGPLEALRVVLGHPYVDLELVAVMKLLVDAQFEGDSQAAAAAIQDGRITRENVVAATKNPLFMTPPELRLQQLKSGRSPEAFLIHACFPDENMNTNFDEAAQHWRAALAGDAHDEAVAALRDMGFH